MSLWEYKVITSGKGGFATPVLLEKFLNDLGRDEWEIIHFQTPPDNFLAFTGLVRRSTQRDWTLEDAAAAAAKAEAEKLRVEFEAKFKAAASGGLAAGAEERAPSFIEEKAGPEDGFRKPVDTSRDDDPDAGEDEKDDWDKLTAAEEDELPTFFEALKPHMRRNQRGPGMSVGVDYLAKKWDQSEEDLKGALEECGFVVPTDEDAKPEYLEYDGDLYWLNVNRRGELWINTKEKPRPVFRPVKAQKVVIEEESKPRAEKSNTPDRRTDTGDRKSAPAETVEGRPDTAEMPAGGEPAETAAQPSKPQAVPSGGRGPLPEGPALLGKIRPHMRRNRRGPGGSGSTSFLARALRTNEADLKAAFTTLGLTIPTSSAEKSVYAEIGDELWWLNLDSRGGLWINGREKKPGETAAAASASEGESRAEPSVSAETTPGAATIDAVPAPEVAPSVPGSADEAERDASERAREIAPMPAEATPGATTVASGKAQPADEAKSAGEVQPGSGDHVFAGVRPLLKETKTGAIAAKVDRLADELGKSPDDVIATLVSAGLKVPEKAREKPVFVEQGGEIFWLNKNARGELWLNAKGSKFADKPEGAEGERAARDQPGAEPAETRPAAESAPGEEGEKKPRRGGRSRSKKTE